MESNLHNAILQTTTATLDRRQNFQMIIHLRNYFYLAKKQRYFDQYKTRIEKCNGRSNSYLEFAKREIFNAHITASVFKKTRFSYCPCYKKKRKEKKILILK